MPRARSEPDWHLRALPSRIQRCHRPIRLRSRHGEQAIELACIRVAFDLLFPFIQIVCCFSGNTIPKLLAFLGGQTLNFLENLFYCCAHNDTSTAVAVTGPGMGSPCFFKLSR